VVRGSIAAQRTSRRQLIGKAAFSYQLHIRAVAEIDIGLFRITVRGCAAEISGRALSIRRAPTCETETFLLPTESRHPDKGFEVVRTTRGRDIYR
jgi:hypothetical protein